MQVKFTDPAKFRLKEIIIFYKITASLKIANKIKQSIFKKALSLKTFPLKGQLEINLATLNQEHRYLLVGHVKIIYRIYNDTIYITDIFDTRQDPSKMGKL